MRARTIKDQDPSRQIEDDVAFTFLMIVVDRKAKSPERRLHKKKLAQKLLLDLPHSIGDL